jgi:hypothetical protein
LSGIANISHDRQPVEAGDNLTQEFESPARRKPAGQSSGSNAIAKRAVARWFCCRTRPICRFTVAGSRRFFDRAMRAQRRSSAALIRRLNLSCIARSLLRRSAERHRIAVSPVSGWRASLTSTPSWTVRQLSAVASSEANFFSSDLGAPMM